MQKHYKTWAPYVFLAPALLLLIVFFFIPFAESFSLSFQSYRHDVYNPAWVGFANYIELFSSPIFAKTMLNTFIFVITAVPILVVFPVIIAIAVNQQLRGVEFYRAMIYIPVVISLVVAGIAWKWLYSSTGVINWLLSFLNIQPVGWLTDPKVALFSVIAVTVWKGLGYYMVIYMSALASIPKELYEAADIDGAGTVNKHLTVTLPHLMPTIALVSVISSISAMKVFVEIYVMTQGGPMNSSKTIVYYIYQRAFESLDLGYASAAGVVLLIITMILSFINMRCFENDKYKAV